MVVRHKVDLQHIEEGLAQENKHQEARNVDMQFGAGVAGSNQE